jgi:hypothetical protein
MKYRHINGPVYCRYAATPPIINSRHADECGIEAHSFVELEEQRNVKVSMLLENRTRRLTCHARVASVKRDETAGGAFDERWIVRLSDLSLTDAEFEVLMSNFADTPQHPLAMRTRVRETAGESKPVTFTGDEEQVVRAKAVIMPLGLIDEIEAKRGDVPFSHFVITAVKEYLKGV